MALLETLGDDFTGSTLNARWTQSNLTSATTTVTGGNLVMALAAATNAYDVILSTTQYTFTGSTFTVKASVSTAFTTASNLQQFLVVVQDYTSSNTAQLWIQGGVLYGGVSGSGTNQVTVAPAYNAATMGHLRLRHNAADGVVYAGYSTDGISFTETAISGAYPATGWGAQTVASLRAFANGGNAAATATIDRVGAGLPAVAVGAAGGRVLTAGRTPVSSRSRPAPTLPAAARTTSTVTRGAVAATAGVAVVAAAIAGDAGAAGRIRRITGVRTQAANGLTGGGGTATPRATVGQLWPRPL